MEKGKRLGATGLIALFLCAGLGTGGPYEAGREIRRDYGPPIFIDQNISLPAPGASSATGPSSLEEAMFATYSFSDRGTVYSIEFYYRGLYNRLRARVLVGDRELHGLFNRFYGIDPTREPKLVSLIREKDDSPTMSIDDHDLRIKEYARDTDAIYDALEGLLGKASAQEKNPHIYMRTPLGLLKKTFWASVVAEGAGGDYLVSETGSIDRLTLESLRVAYNKEGIRARNADDYKEIAWSLIVAGHEPGSHGEIVLVSSTNQIPGYSSHPLDPGKETEVEAPQVRSDPNTHTDRWMCYTYEQFHGIVARYTSSFKNGQLQSVDKLVLGEDIGKAYYLGGELGRTSPRSAPRPTGGRYARPRGPIRQFPFEIIGAASGGVGALLLLCAFLLHRHTGVSLRRQKDEGQ